MDHLPAKTTNSFGDDPFFNCPRLLLEPICEPMGLITIGGSIFFRLACELVVAGLCLFRSGHGHRAQFYP